VTEEEMALEKLDAVAVQIAALQSGQRNYIICPYCGDTTPEGHAFCCDTLRLAAAAIVERQEVERIGNGLVN
jgi:hypothetical protein